MPPRASVSPSVTGSQWLCGPVPTEVFPHLPLCLGRGRAGADIPLLALVLGFRPRPRDLAPGSSDPGVPPSLLSPVSLLVFRLRRLALGTRRAGDGSAPAGQDRRWLRPGLCSPGPPSIICHGGQGLDNPAADPAWPAAGAAWLGRVAGVQSGVCRHRKLHGGSSNEPRLPLPPEDAQNHGTPEVRQSCLQSGALEVTPHLEPELCITLKTEVGTWCYCGHREHGTFSDGDWPASMQAWGAWGAPRAPAQRPLWEPHPWFLPLPSHGCKTVARAQS